MSEAGSTIQSESTQSSAPKIIESINLDKLLLSCVNCRKVLYKEQPLRGNVPVNEEDWENLK